MQQRIATTTVPGVGDVAFAVSGEGPVLVYVPGWLTHLELGWNMPQERAFYEALSKGRTLVRFDNIGCGLSDRSDRAFTIDLQLRALAAVVEAVGATEFDLMGISLGSAVAATWAARYPKTVRRLVLYGGWLEGAQIAEPEVRASLLGLIESHWGLGSDVLSDIFAPDNNGTTRSAFARYQRESAAPSTARAMLALGYTVDLRQDAARISAPTLVVHRERDRGAPVRQARALADAIPGAGFVALPGRNHLPYVGDSDALVRVIRKFLGLRTVRRSLASPTPRQRQVAALVADGLTNRAIAAQLGISERSAESHIERMRERMGFRSRAQIAAWHVEDSASR